MSDDGARESAGQEELERLASRIAMLASDDGEAEAAGRAVGHLARKLGLSGGHLKMIFLAGAGRLAAAGRQSAEHEARADRLQFEAGGLQYSLEQVDLAFRQMRRERDAMAGEAASLRGALDRVRNARRVQVTSMLLLLAALAGAVVFAVFGPPLRPLLGLSFDPASLAEHVATTRDPGASVLAEPDPAKPVLFRLPGGVRILVRRLVWRNFNQWAETRLGGQTGYIVVTSLDLQADATH